MRCRVIIETNSVAYCYFLCVFYRHRLLTPSQKRICYTIRQNDLTRIDNWHLKVLVAPVFLVLAEPATRPRFTDYILRVICFSGTTKFWKQTVSISGKQASAYLHQDSRIIYYCICLVRGILLPLCDLSSKAFRRGLYRGIYALYVLLVELSYYTTQSKGGDTGNSSSPPMKVVRTIHRLLEQAAFIRTNQPLSPVTFLPNWG